MKTNMFSFDLGSRSFLIGTSVPMAQSLFDQGLNWCFGFNQEEALACFREALKNHLSCGMLHWGVACAAGSFYNMTWNDFFETEAGECTAFCQLHFVQLLTFNISQ